MTLAEAAATEYVAGRRATAEDLHIRAELAFTRTLMALSKGNSQTVDMKAKMRDLENLLRKLPVRSNGYVNPF